MATIFEIYIQHPDPEYSSQAARQAFKQLETLEEQLSRFIPWSDISRINNAPAGLPVIISPESFECLEIAGHISRQTGGAFDITVGLLVDTLLSEDKATLNPSPGNITGTAKPSCDASGLVLDKEWLTAMRTAEQIRLDAGAVGKGFALDKMAQVLREWRIDKAMLCAATSTILAMGKPDGKKGWPVNIRHPFDHDLILCTMLCNRALSCSGVTERPHIIDPRSGKVARRVLQVWSSAAAAAYADALSTAFVVMTAAEMDTFFRNHPETAAIVVLNPSAPGKRNAKLDELVIKYGKWD